MFWIQLNMLIVALGLAGILTTMLAVAMRGRGLFRKVSPVFMLTFVGSWLGGWLTASLLNLSPESAWIPTVLIAGVCATILAWVSGPDFGPPMQDPPHPEQGEAREMDRRTNAAAIVVAGFLWLGVGGLALIAFASDVS